MPVTGVSRPMPSTCRPRRICRRSTEAQAVDEVKLALAVLKYARYARGGRLSPGKISDAVRPEARTGQPEDRVDRDRRRARARRLSHLAASEARPVRGPAQAADQVCGQRQGARTQADGRSRHPAADRQHGAVALDARRSRQLLRLEQRALFRHAGDEGRQVHLCREGHCRAAEIRDPAVLGEHALH